MGMKHFSIEKLDYSLVGDLREKIDQKTKPLGALGQLEEVALQVGLIQRTFNPKLRKPTIVVFAADHGITASGVSAYPKEVTQQMVLNFLQGGAAINVFCRQNNIDILIVDAGIDFEFPSSSYLIHAKVAKGTKNFLYEKAMTHPQAEQAIEQGAKIVRDIFKRGTNTIGFGDMGIGNTTSASVMMHLLTGLPLTHCVGRGAGLDDRQLQHKISILKEALEKHKTVPHDPEEVLTTFGGFEIAMMCGGYLQAAELKMVILIDGFIATVAFLLAYHFYPELLDYAIFCHQSEEMGHAHLLKFFQVKPLLDLNMRLGEGTGVALAFPIVLSAVNFLNEMASFASAGVSPKI